MERGMKGVHVRDVYERHVVIFCRRSVLKGHYYEFAVIITSFRGIIMLRCFCIVQAFASTYPGRPPAADRLQSRLADLEPPVVTRRSAAADLLTEYTTPEAGESGSDSDRVLEDEELAQNSDSAVGKRPTLLLMFCLYGY